MFDRSYKIARIWGIPIKIHISLIILLVIYAVSTGISGPALAIPILLAMEFLIFLSILLHELGHSFVAIRKGVRVREIVLTFIGGAAMMEEMPRKPFDEFQMAATGPIVSVAIGLAAYFGGEWLTNNDSPLLGLILSRVGVINFFLAGFNLLPSFPMDGGRILRALLTPRKGRLRATQIAARLGKFIAVLFGVVGIFGLPGVIPPFSFILLAIAFFVYSSAQREYRLVLMQETMGQFGFDVRSAPPSPGSPPPLPDEDVPEPGDDQVSISPPPYRKGPGSKAPIQPEDRNPFFRW